MTPDPVLPPVIRLGPPQVSVMPAITSTDSLKLTVIGALLAIVAPLIGTLLTTGGASTLTVMVSVSINAPPLPVLPWSLVITVMVRAAEVPGTGV